MTEYYTFQQDSAPRTRETIALLASETPDSFAISMASEES